MHADLATLRERVIETAQKSPVAQQVRDVALEADRDDEGTDFLLVIIQVQHDEDASETGFEALLEAIESAVGAIDDRYPSVRILDAA